MEDGVVTIGLDKRIQYMNRAAEELMGYSLDEAREMPCAEVVHCTACVHNCLLDRALANGKSITRYETVLQNRQGRVYSISSNTALLRDPQGRVIGAVEIIRDCSQIHVLSEALRGKYSFENIIGKNHRMREIYSLLPGLANSRTPVMIEGGLGTGKELLAQAIHQNGPRAGKPFVKIPCGLLTDRLLASELFGHARGAFTGAYVDKVGQFEQAEGGTIFLDEIGDVGPIVQARLLQFLKEDRIERLGDPRGIQADVRVIASTHRRLDSVVKEGSFHPDLHDRLMGAVLRPPLLSERRDDIPLLIEHFLSRYGEEYKKPVRSVSPEAMEVLLNYGFPENIQELENIIEHAVVLCAGETVLPAHLPRDIFAVKDDFVDKTVDHADPLQAMEKELMLKVLAQSGWNFMLAAKRLKISRTTLWRRLKAHGIDRAQSHLSPSKQ